MNQVITHNQAIRHYQPTDEAMLYIDHRPGATKATKKLRQILDLMDARFKLVADKRARANRRSRKVREQLRRVGLSRFDLLKPETFQIAKLLHEDEEIRAAICGHVEEGGSALIVVTDQRIVYLNLIPLFTKIEEVGYGMVEGVGADIGQFDATVTLHAGINDITLHRVSIDAAENFVDAIETVAYEAHRPPSGYVEPV